MTTRTLLIIEDDAAIRQGVDMAVRSAGHRTLTCGDGHQARLMIAQATCDLVLPGASGLELLQQIRREQPGLPVIIMTAMGDERDRIKGLELGADDYVVKPFSVRELLARIDAVLRRSPERAVPVSLLDFPAGTADFARRELRYHDGGRSGLSDREADLLAYLGANPGRAISREEILTRVWRLDPKGLSTRAIDMQVVRLREKLRDDGAEPAVLLTVRGTGYMLASNRATSAAGVRSAPGPS